MKHVYVNVVSVCLLKQKWLFKIAIFRDKMSEVKRLVASVVVVTNCKLQLS